MGKMCAPIVCKRIILLGRALRMELSILSYFLIYFFVVNIVGFFMMYLDKQRSRRQEWRIAEKTLLIIAVIGGALGVLIGMKVFRHKTKKPLFQLGVPVILVLQAAFVIYLKYV